MKQLLLYTLWIYIDLKKSSSGALFRTFVSGNAMHGFSTCSIGVRNVAEIPEDATNRTLRLSLAEALSTMPGPARNGEG